MRDLERRKDAQIATVVDIIALVAPDILLLNDFDYDFGGVALALFAERLSDAGVIYPYQFALPPNAGIATGLDLDGDGRTGGPGDAQGFGSFSGSQGMALLSRLPIRVDEAVDYSKLLWKDLPNAVLPLVREEDIFEVQRLSSKGHWVVPVEGPDSGILYILASHSTPPVFDGAEDRNGLRNRDEIRFWSLFLDAEIQIGQSLPNDARFVLLGDMNADPMDGEGARKAINDLLVNSLLQDAVPQSRGAVLAADRQGGPNKTHGTDPSFDTVDWDESRTPGNMRVDYVLPSANLKVTGAGVFWPAPGEVGFELVGLDGSTGSHHRLVWVDVLW